MEFSAARPGTMWEEIASSLRSSQGQEQVLYVIASAAKQSQAHDF
jgi:hypothetical protein